MKQSKQPPNTRVGIVVGVHGWLIGAVIAFASGGHYAALGEVVAIGLPLSLAMSAVAVLLLEGVLQRHGRGRTFQLTLFGTILFVIGTVILLLNHWLAPIIEGTPGLHEDMKHLGGVYRTHDILPALCLVAATVLLVMSLRQPDAPED